MNRYIETLLSITILLIGVVLECGIVSNYFSSTSRTSSIDNIELLSVYSDIQLEYVGRDVGNCTIIKNVSGYSIYVCSEFPGGDVDGYLYPIYLDGELGVVICMLRRVYQ